MSGSNDLSIKCDFWSYQPPKTPDGDTSVEYSYVAQTSDGSRGATSDVTIGDWEVQVRSTGTGSNPRGWLEITAGIPGQAYASQDLYFRKVENHEGESPRRTLAGSLDLKVPGRARLKLSCRKVPHSASQIAHMAASARSIIATYDGSSANVAGQTVKPLADRPETEGSQRYLLEKAPYEGTDTGRAALAFATEEGFYLRINDRQQFSPGVWFGPFKLDR